MRVEYNKEREGLAVYAKGQTLRIRGTIWHSHPRFYVTLQKISVKTQDMKNAESTLSPLPWHRSSNPTETLSGLVSCPFPKSKIRRIFAYNPRKYILPHFLSFANIDTNTTLCSAYRNQFFFCGTNPPLILLC